MPGRRHSSVDTVKLMFSNVTSNIMLEVGVRWAKRMLLIRVPAKLILIFFSLCLFSCSNTMTYAPVSDATIERIPKSGIIQVKRNETLYSIAWRYGLDPYYVARRNQLSPPYAIYSGQKLYLTGKPKKIVPKIIPKGAAIAPAPMKAVIFKAPVAFWSWPARGPLVKGFSGSNKGINIGGHAGDPVFATAAGSVVYSGNGLRGYGNLIIIAHNLTYMSAYAYNRKNYVKEGQFVRSGQKIAEMGVNSANKAILHFEIRRQGMPVNPLKYLSS
jgi:lipoprotein NlpD